MANKPEWSRRGKTTEERKAWVDKKKAEREAKMTRSLLVGSKRDDEFVSEIPEVINIEEGKYTTRRPGKPTVYEQRLFKKNPDKKSKMTFYTDAKKMEAACAYAVTGNSRRVSEITGIPECTIRTWKTTEWWEDISKRIQQEANDELDTKLSRMIDKAVSSINDRLEEGDYVYNAHQDKLVRKPVGAKEMASITAMAIDKRQLLRGEPTSRVQKVSENEKLVRLAEQFKNFVKAKEVVSVAESIEEESFVAQQETIVAETVDLEIDNG